MSKKEYKNGQIVEGVITGIQPYGAFVKIDENASGLIHISEISEDFVRDIRRFVKDGEKVIAKVIDNREGQKHLRLSLKALDYSSRKERVDETYRRPLLPKSEKGFTTLAKSLPEWIGERENRMIKVNLEHALLEEEIRDYQEQVSKVHAMIHEKTGQGSDFLGWLDWSENFDRDEFSRVKTAAKKIREQADVLLVCGIGGSYLGSRAAIEMLQGPLYQDDLEVLFIGNTFSSTALVRTLDYIKDKEVALNVISKSGTTTETSLAFRMIRQFMEEKYGEEEAAERIYATTDANKGVLKDFADKKGYETFVIPDDIGGRFSVITPVGLLPIAAAGIDIDEMMRGVSEATVDFAKEKIEDNAAYQYAVARRILEKQGKDVEMFVTYEPHHVFFAEWWKQLLGESEGKEGKGLLPASVNFSTDLHSLGQFVQEGKKVLFETLLWINEPLLNAEIPSEEEDDDQLNYLSGKDLHWVNEQAMKGTLQAHVETGEVPNVIIELEKMDAYHFGYLVYFFFKALAMTVYMIDVNPFDQPGVEVYKANMFKLLGK